MAYPPNDNAERRLAHLKLRLAAVSRKLERHDKPEIKRHRWPVLRYASTIIVAIFLIITAYIAFS